MIRINNLVGDRYKIIGELGHGGMSDVYEARDIIFKRQVALKIIKFENAQKIEIEYETDWWTDEKACFKVK